MDKNLLKCLAVFSAFWIGAGYIPLALASEKMGSRSYVVQLNAFTIEKNAQNFIARFLEKGYPVFLDHDHGERWYKVRVGPYPDWDRALEVSRAFRRDEKLNPLVLLTFNRDHVSESVQEKSQKRGPNQINSQTVVQKAGLSQEAQAGSTQVKEDSIDLVVARFMEWKSAWEEKDLAAYLQFYSLDFDCEPKTRKAWKRSRKRALSRPGKIVIDVGEVRIQPRGDQVEMSFIQNFKSIKFSDVGHKTLVWQLENGQWTILSERWFPI